MFHKNFLYALYILVLILFLSHTTFAQFPSNELIGVQTLGFAMDHINCKIDFTNKVINSLVTISPDNFSNLTTYTVVLQKDQSILQNYTNSGDVSSFRTFIKNSFDPDYKQIRDSIVNQRDLAPLTTSLSVKIKTNYNSLRTDYEKCAFSTLDNYATTKLNAYQNIISNYQLEMFSLNSKGIDISFLVQLLQNENTQIISPLALVVNTVNPTVNASSDLRVALNKYCLFDGCINGINGHLSGNFEVLKLQAILNYMKSQPRYAQTGSHLNEAQNYINKARAGLDEVGTSAYNSTDQAYKVWDNAYAASYTLKAVVSTYGG